jgi:hypothetical protein
MSFKHIKNIPNNIVVRNGYTGFNFPLKLGSLLPVIIAQPIPFSRSLFPGLSTVLAVEVEGIEPITYQWYKDNTLITGASSKTFDVLNTAPSSVGGYYVEVSNPFGTIASGIVSISYNYPVGIVGAPQSLTAYYLNDIDSDKATFTVSVTGAAPISYNWYKNSSLIVGALSSSYTASYKLSDSGSQFIVSVKNFTTPVSASAILTVFDTPLGFVSQPVSQTVNPGFSSVTFTVQASGRLPISYQWRKNGTNIFGETTQSLTLSNIQETDDASYDVIVSNLSGLSDTPVSLTSIQVSLFVNDPIGIINQPVNEIYVGLGGTITLSAEVSGTQPYYFEWYKDTNLITGANLSAYSLTANQANDLGTFFYVASNIVNSVTSNNIALLPAFPPGILSPTSTQNLAVNPNSNTIFYCDVTGTNVQFQWKKNSTIIPTATTNPYIIFNTQESDEGSYILVATNNWGTVSSVSFELSANDPVGITTPLVQSLTAGIGTLTLSAQVSGTQPITFEWYKNQTLVPGENLSAYQITLIPESVVDEFYYTATNIVNSVTSTTLSVIPTFGVAITNPTVTQLVTADPNQSTTFSVTASGSNIAYQWKKNTTSIPYASTSSYTLNNIQESDQANYVVVASNNVNSVTSVMFTLSVNDPAGFIVEPSFNSFATVVGATITLSAIASGTNVNYSWYKDNIQILGESLSSYTLPTLTLGDNGTTYIAVVYNHLSSVSSTPITLNVYETYDIWNFDAPIVETTLSSFAVGLSTGNLKYLIWGDGSYNTEIISGSATNHTYASALSVGFIQNLSPLNAYFDNAVSPLSTFNVIASGTDVNYEWSKQDSRYTSGIIPGASASSYTFNAAPYGVGDTIKLYCRIYNSVNSINSLTANIDTNLE